MPPGSKRKFNSYQELSGAMAPQDSNRGALPHRPIPTLETQDLYNRMRQEEERLTADSLGRMPSGQAGFLHPPSPSQTTTRSRSPSYASSTHSISHAMDDLGVDEQPRVKKPRSGRQGPLRESTKLRAALMRKIGACEDCRGRKVKCDHFDFSLFEAAYDASKRAASQPINNGFHPTHAAQPPFGDSAVDLLGVGGGQNFMGYPSLRFQEGNPSRWDDAHPDFDLLRNQPPLARPHLQSFLSAFEGPQPPALTLSPQYPHISAPVPTPVPTPQNNPEVPIGKQTTPVSKEWICLWGSNEYASLVPSGELGPCNQSFDNAETLKRHFATCHARFYKERHSFVCIKCGVEVSNPINSRCPACTQPERFTWQEWCWARLEIPSKPPLLNPSRVGSQDGSPSNCSSWTNPSAQFPSSPSGGYGYPWMPPTGGYGYGNGNGNGNGYDHKTAHAAPSTGIKRSIACCEKTIPTASHPGKSSVTDMWHPVFCPKSELDKNVRKTALIRNACPAAIVLSFFIIALIDNWVFAGRGGLGGGLDRIASSILSWIIPDDQIKMSELSIACIAAGLVISWLFRHVKSRLKHQPAALQFERGDVRDIVDISPFEQYRHGPVGITAAA